MKLIRTYNSDGVVAGYFDLQTTAAYCVGSPSRKAGEAPRYRVEVSQGEHFYQFLSPLYDTREDALAELYRIAALISGETASVGQGWVKGQPPHDGNYYVVLGFDDGPCVVSGHPDNDPDSDYSTPSGSDACRDVITHYMPLPKEPNE